MKPNQQQNLAGFTIDGRYELLEALGEGGIGLVFRARHSKLGTPCAVKVLRLDRVCTPERIKRFRREARIASELQHPAIIKAHDFGATTDGLLYVVMELLHGEDLAQLLAREGTLTWRRALRVIRQCTDALSVVHANGIVHRDLKPANVFLIDRQDGHDHVRLLDFGIAKLLDEESDLTDTGTAIGTVSYMAPEQIRGVASIDHRADIYALGIMLYQLLTGKLPFTGANQVEIAVKHCQQTPQPPHEVAPLASIPPAVEAIVMRAIEKDPDDRFANMLELTNELDKLLSPPGDEQVTTPSYLDDLRTTNYNDAPRPAQRVPPSRSNAGLPTSPAAELNSEVTTQRYQDLSPAPRAAGATVQFRAIDKPKAKALQSNNGLKRILIGVNVAFGFVILWIVVAIMG